MPKPCGRAADAQVGAMTLHSVCAPLDAHVADANSVLPSSINAACVSVICASTAGESVTRIARAPPDAGRKVGSICSADCAQPASAAAHVQKIDITPRKCIGLQRKRPEKPWIEHSRTEKLTQNCGANFRGVPANLNQQEQVSTLYNTDWSLNG